MAVCLFFKFPLSLFMCRHITHKFIQLTCGGASSNGYQSVDGPANAAHVHDMPRTVSIEGDQTQVS
jgi:hypothetical protein